MKAYTLYIDGNEDAGQEIVFANTAREAKKQIYGTDLGGELENWTDLRVNRDKRYDGMESLTRAQLSLKLWRDGWRYFDLDYPNPDTASDEEFLKWHYYMFEKKP
jgi:hypothetical protein